MLNAIVTLGLILVASVFYFFPSMIAHARSHRYESAIFLLNLLLGWTFLGWIFALVWALWTPYPRDRWSA